MTEPPRPRLIYFADTMCSWCYGFAPEMNRVVLEMGERIDLILQAGGLRPFNTAVMTEADKPRFRGYRERVQEASGQPFDWSFFDREGYVMDTEPASRAVVTMRTLNIGAAYAYLHAIQRAYFALNEDIRQPEVLAAYAGQFEIDPAEFAAAFESETMKQATLQDFALAQRFEVNGFPTLVLLKDRAAYQITVGYEKAESVIESLERALAHAPPAAPAA
ncbi:MAG: DsbA family protein [Methylocystis sp.]|nr:DsbA family protein [Methylocystis sp.]MCA3585332.1 DsbA family protein [Methylocystis sp.]MCA3587390.1 DsbA family protein [Methylocystis sp.]MCA3593339.1 DsbA family protein [Methylocystis sp.]